MRLKRKTVYSIVITILVVSLIISLVLPELIKRYAEHTLNKIPSYQVHLSDVKVQLYRGRYFLQELQLEKTDKHILVPFFTADRIILALEWSALLKGVIVGQIIIIKPQLNFVIDAKTGNEQLTIDDYWRQAVKALFPLNFDRIIIQDGTIHLRDYTSAQPFDVAIYHVNAELNNLCQVVKTKSLAATLAAQAKMTGAANLDLSLMFDPSVKQANFTLAAKIEHMNLREANDFFAHYMKLRTQSGIFSLYLEAIAKNGKVSGYVKPLIKDLKIANPKEASPIKKIYRATAQALAEVLKNKQTDKVATQIKISGSIDDPDMSLWSLLSNLLKNAFIQALLPNFDASFRPEVIDIMKPTSLK